MLIARRSYFVIAIFFTLLVMGGVKAQGGGTVSGSAKVLAGDTLGIAGQVVLLAGIRPPYPAQACKRNNKPWACGKQSARTLSQLTLGKTVRCRVIDHDNQSRILAVCHTVDGELNAQMVKIGMALASNDASSQYKTLQAAAKSARRGLWASEFIHPAKWRRGKRLPGMAAMHPELKGGVDDRVLVKERDYPWRTIGRIDNGGRGYCSGVLISPTFVLTAGHCLYNKRTKKPYPASVLHFAAGLKGDQYVAHSRGKRVHPSPYFALRANAANGLAADDWGLLELAQPIGNKVGYIGWTRIGEHNIGQFHRDGIRFIQAGYSQDRPRGMSAHIGCQFIGDPVDKLYLAHHNCDAINGSSGSPIFYISRGQLRVVGVHSATLTTDKDQKIGGAILTGRFADYLRQHVAEGNGHLPTGTAASAAKSAVEKLTRQIQKRSKRASAASR